MGLLVPKKYNPPGKHTPMEYPALLTRKEMGLLKAHGGAGKKTKWGVPSFVAPPGTKAGIGNTNTNGSKANTNTGNTGTGGSMNPGRGGSGVGLGTSDRSQGSQGSNGGGSGPASGNNGLGGGGRPNGAGGQGNTNSGNTGTGGAYNAGRGGSAVGGGLGFGADPAKVARAVSALAGPQYSGPARYNDPFNANRSQQTFGGYPNSMAGSMPGQPQGFASTVNQVAPVQPSGSYFGDFRAPNKTYPSPADNAEIKALQDHLNYSANMGRYTQPNAPQQVSSLGYQDPQAQRQRALAVSRGPGTLTGILPNSSPSARKQMGFALLNAFDDKPPPSSLGLDDLVSPSREAQAQADREKRALAVSRGPGSVAGVMPGASPLSQQRTLQTLAGSMNEDPRFRGKQFSASGLSDLSRTMAGEAGSESPMGQTAAANTMVNRMALAAKDPKKYGYMGGTSIDSLMGQYDASGRRKGTAPNAAFKAAVPGTNALGNGIASLAGALASNSQFTQTAPAGVQNATHFLTDKAKREQAKRPQGPTNWSNDPNNPFTKFGAHNFGTAENIASQVAALRGATPSGGPPQVASATAGPPVQQTPTSNWYDGLPGAGMVKEAYRAVDENLVQPTQEQIAKYGGFERAGRLARTAVAIMNAFGGTGAPLGPGGQERGGGPPRGAVDPRKPNAPPRTQDVTPPVQPPVNPMTAWMYPQYQSQWANLPSGIGGYARG